MLPLQKFHRLDLIFPMHIPFLFTAITAAVLIPYLQTDLANPDKVHLTTWWIVLCCISVFNIAWWTISAMTVLGSRSTTNNNVKTTSRVPKQGVSEMNSNFEFSQVILSAGYVFGCAFRSIVPRADVQRICLIDNWISTVLVGKVKFYPTFFLTISRKSCCHSGRTLFCGSMGCCSLQNFLGLKMSQCALDFQNSLSDDRYGRNIFLVRLFYDKLHRKCDRGIHVGRKFIPDDRVFHYPPPTVREKNWNFLIFLRRKITKNMRNFLLLSALFSFGYLLFMCFVDVPMYFSRLLEDISTGKQFLSFYEGKIPRTFHRTISSWKIHTCSRLKT